MLWDVQLVSGNPVAGATAATLALVFLSSATGRRFLTLGPVAAAIKDPGATINVVYVTALTGFGTAPLKRKGRRLAAQESLALDAQGRLTGAGTTYRDRRIGIKPGT